MKKNIHTSLFFLLLAFFCNPGEGSSAEPWQWHLALQVTADSSGPAMDMPTALYVDEGLERYYVTDAGNNRLLSFDLTGKLLSSFSANDDLLRPFDMVRDAGGVLWVVEKGRNSLTSIDLQSKELAIHLLHDQQQPVYPDRMELVDGIFYILDKATGAVMAFDGDLTLQRKLLCSDCETGFIDFSANSEAVWALASSEHAVYRFSHAGVLKERIALDGEIAFPYSLTVGPAGNFYVLDRHEGTIVVFAGNGEFRYKFLGKGQAKGQLYFPVELKFDPWGRLCVVEEGNGRVQIFSRR